MAFDVAFGVMVLAGAWHGARTGFARIMLNVTGIVVGLLLAETLAKTLLPSLGPRLWGLPAPVTQSVLFVGSGVVIWLAIFALGSLWLMWYRTRVFGENRPSAPDRMLGVMLGTIEAALVAALVIFGWDLVPSAVRNASAVKSHYQESKVIKTLGEYQVIEKIVALPESQRLGEHLKTLASHFRAPVKQAQNADDAAFTR